jgi:hypothetical protein
MRSAALLAVMEFSKMMVLEVIAARIFAKDDLCSGKVSGFAPDGRP